MLWELKKAMSMQKITMRQLAYELGITERTLCRKINGKAQFVLKEMLKIRELHFKEYSLDELFRVEDGKRSA